MARENVNNNNVEAVAPIRSELIRRVERASSVVRKIIYLKRRCIRCYFVNLISAFILLAIFGNAVSHNFRLIYGQSDLFYSIAIFFLSMAVMILGSGVSIYAMTKKLKKTSFIIGNILSTTAIMLNAVAILSKYIFSSGGAKLYGYPRDILEDCDAYPDHTFSLIVRPKNRKGEPYEIDDHHIHDVEEVEGKSFPDEGRVSSTTEDFETETYNCQEMLYNVKWLKTSYVCMMVLLSITVIALTLALIGIVHLYCIHRRGLEYSLLPPALVEPYEAYDNILNQNLSSNSVPQEQLPVDVYQQKKKVLE